VTMILSMNIIRMRLVILQGPKCFRIAVPHRRDYFTSLPFISWLGLYMIPFELLNPTNHNSPVHEVFYNSPKGENAAIPPSNTHARAPLRPVIHHGRFFRHGIPFPHFLVISFLNTIKKLPYINTFISSIFITAWPSHSPARAHRPLMKANISFSA